MILKSVTLSHTNSLAEGPWSAFSRVSFATKNINVKIMLVE